MLKVVWVVNLPIGPLAEQQNCRSSSGTWLEAALNEINNSDNDIYVITTLRQKEKIVIDKAGVHYIVLPTGDSSNFICSEANIKKWSEEFQRIDPDIIQIWGTEYLHAIAVLRAKPANAKALIYVQGVMQSVYQHYLGGINRKTLLKYTSPVEILSGKTIFNARSKVKVMLSREETAATLADGVILETKWSDTYFRLFYNCDNIYYHKLPLNNVFRERVWSVETMQRHIIFTAASDYPLKGLHMLLQALPYVKKKYSDVKLVIPGYQLTRKKSFAKRFRAKAYRRYLHKLITDYGIWDNVDFMGVLTPAQMAEKMFGANVFVCASAIENHSSTLREAMMIGTPCISTAVGGIPEYLSNNINGLIYDFSDPIALAKNILAIFDDDELAKRLGSAAHREMTDYYNDSFSSLNEIYEQAR